MNVTVSPEVYNIPLENQMRETKQGKQLRIGVPKETFFQENRVALTPDAAAVLVNNGHKVMVETNAGLGARYSDHDFAEAGAIISHNVADLYNQSDFILKICPPSEAELPLLKDGQCLISAINLGSLKSDYLWHLIRKNITAIAFEFFQSFDGSLPLIQMMSEIAGVSSIQIACELLANKEYGQGILLGGVTGIPPAVITIIGAGTVGYHAARTALGMGARVRIIDESLPKLIAIKKELGFLDIYTAIAQYNYIKDAVMHSDVVIGAAFRKGKRAPLVVSEEMVQLMKSGSVIIDVAIDQGGCVETSEITSHENPTFIKHDIVHYCVPNIASKYARTASIAVSNILGPLMISLGENGGLEGLMRQDEGLKQGIYTYRRHVTKKTVANMFGMGMNYRDIGLLIATVM
jgi:alanine dehydrogenase